MYKKAKGLDSRQIKCCDNSENTIEAGISFDTDENGTKILRFHFLDNIMGSQTLHEVTKSMHLNKENTNELINALKSIRFKNKYERTCAKPMGEIYLVDIPRQGRCGHCPHWI